MKKAISLIIIISMLLLTSCDKKVKLYFEEDGTLGNSSLSYNYAPVGYEPTNQGEEYAIIKGTMEETLYKIGDCNPEMWLTTEYAGAATLVYYNTSITLPTLAQMNPSLCYICEQDVNAFSIYTLGDGEDGEKDIIAQIVSEISRGESDEIWPRSDATATYSLKFYSEDWPAIYYNLVYAVCPDCNIVYDRVTDVCVSIGDILTPYYENSYDENE